MTFSMPKRRKRKRFCSRPQAHYRSQSYLAHVRGFICSISGLSGHICEGRIEAAHIRIGSHAGLSQKPHDYLVTPLCSAAHREQHRIGEITFWHKYGLDPLIIADRLWKASKHYRDYLNREEK